jgi:NTE family protein
MTPRLRRPVGLVLSGGGYRAMLFHVGALARLNDAGLLPELDQVSSVSGGSIAAATLGARWHRLAFDDGGRATAFDTEVARPLRSLATASLDRRAVLGALARPGVGTAELIGRELATRLFGSLTVSDLPDRPVITIGVTDLRSGEAWRVARSGATPEEARRVAATLPLASLVAASTAYAPFLGPLALPGGGACLADGGFTDQLGVTGIQGACETLLVSDAMLELRALERVRRDWVSTMFRSRQIAVAQVLEMRRRETRAALRGGRTDGAYWRIPGEARSMPTRLVALGRSQQDRLIDWGYGATDAALRSVEGLAAAAR